MLKWAIGEYDEELKVLECIVSITIVFEIILMGSEL
jgi:hypothetical protein